MHVTDWPGPPSLPSARRPAPHEPRHPHRRSVGITPFRPAPSATRAPPPTPTVRGQAVPNPDPPTGPLCQRPVHTTAVLPKPTDHFCRVPTAGTSRAHARQRPHTSHPRESPWWSCDRGARMKTPVARLGDAAASRAGQAALEGHRAVATSRGGRENSAQHKDFRGGSGPSSCLLAMKRHGPFSSPRSRA